MSKVLQEGDLVFDFSAAIVSDQFDDPSTHKLAHCMKAVDFIVEWEHEFGMRMRFIVPLTVKPRFKPKPGKLRHKLRHKSTWLFLLSAQNTHCPLQESQQCWDTKN